MWDTKTITVCCILSLYERSALWRIRGKVGLIRLSIFGYASSWYINCIVNFPFVDVWLGPHTHLSRLSYTTEVSIIYVTHI